MITLSDYFSFVRGGGQTTRMLLDVLKCPKGSSIKIIGVSSKHGRNLASQAVEMCKAIHGSETLTISGGGPDSCMDGYGFVFVDHAVDDAGWHINSHRRVE